MRQSVYEKVSFSLPWETAREYLALPPERWLPAPATPEQGGVVVTMRALGVGVDAVVEVGSVVEAGAGLLVRPVAWRARLADRLFPRMVGELELSAISDTACQLALVGGYEPPINVIGDAADRVMGRHVATSVVGDLLEDVVDRLLELSGSGVTSP